MMSNEILEKKIRNILGESNVHALQQDIITKDLLVLYNNLGHGENLVCGDLIKHNFSLSKMGRCIICDREKEK